MADYNDVWEFWFETLSEDQWFHAGEDVDHRIRVAFFGLHERVQKNECWQWRDLPKGALSEVIVLDQFSRNIFRSTPNAFAHDDQALALAQVAIEKGFDQEVSERERAFFYLPFMHSESTVIQAEALKLFTSLGSEVHLTQAKLHKDIVDQFGRFPHRNEILGRPSTEDEIKFLEENDHVFFNA